MKGAGPFAEDGWTEIAIGHTKKDAESATSEEYSLTNPTIKSHVFLRIQPFYMPSPLAALQTAVPHVGEAGKSSVSNLDQFQFIIHLSDPSNKIKHTTITQAVPARYDGALMRAMQRLDYIPVAR